MKLIWRQVDRQNFFIYQSVFHKEASVKLSMLYYVRKFSRLTHLGWHTYHHSHPTLTYTGQVTTFAKILDSLIFDFRASEDPHHILHYTNLSISFVIIM